MPLGFPSRCNALALAAAAALAVEPATAQPADPQGVWSRLTAPAVAVADRIGDLLNGWGGVFEALAALALAPLALAAFLIVFGFGARRALLALSMLLRAGDGVSGVFGDAAGATRRSVSTMLSSASVQSTWIWMTRLGLIGLAVLFSITLSIASFYTTYNGLLNFANSATIALLAALGIQGILFIASWVVASESAMHANKRRRIGRALEEEEEDAATALRRAGRWIGGGFSYLLARPFSALLLAVTLFISVFFSFDSLFDQVYTPAERALTNRKVARSDIASTLEILHRGLTEERAKLSEELLKQDAWKDYSKFIDDVAAKARTAKAAIEEENKKQRDALQRDYAMANKSVETIGQEVAAAQAKFDALNKAGSGTAFNVDADAVAAKERELKDIEARLSAATGVFNQANDRVAELKDNLKNEDLNGGKIGNGKRRPGGQGSAWKAIKADLGEAEIKLASARDALDGLNRDAKRRRDEIAQMQARSSDAATRAVQEREATRLRLEERAGALELAKKNRDDIKRQLDLIWDSGAQAADAASGASKLVDDMADAKTRFAGSGALEDFRAVGERCARLVGLLKRTQPANAPNPASCDSAAIAASVKAFEAVNRSLALFDGAPVERPEVVKAREDWDAKAAAATSARVAAAALSGYRAADARAKAEEARIEAEQAKAAYDSARATLTCQVDQDFSDFSVVDAFLSRARFCLGHAHLASADMNAVRGIIDRVEQENSPDTSHFERTSASLRRGDALAWLALFIASALDGLVLIAAILGERTLLSPLQQDGLVGSKTELEDLAAENRFAPLLYPDERNDIRNYKIFVNHVATEWVAPKDKAGGRGHSISVVDLNRADPDHAAVLAKMINSAATSDPPRAHGLRNRPGVFQVESALVRHFSREIGLYEEEHARLHGPRDESLGQPVRPLEAREPARAPVRDDPYKDPFEPDEPARAASARAETESENVVAMRGGARRRDAAVNDSRPHPDARFYN